MTHTPTTSAKPSESPIFVRIGQCKHWFGVHKNTIYRWAAEGEINLYKRGECTFLKVSEVTAFITGQSEPSEDAA